jgi:hypothetical protein
LHKKKLKRKKLAEAEESWKFARDFGDGVLSFFLTQRETERHKETERGLVDFQACFFAQLSCRLFLSLCKLPGSFFCFGSGRRRRRRRRSLFPVSLTWSEASEAGVLEAVVG